MVPSLACIVYLLFFSEHSSILTLLLPEFLIILNELKDSLIEHVAHSLSLMFTDFFEVTIDFVLNLDSENLNQSYQPLIGHYLMVN